MILSLHAIQLDAPLNQTGASFILTELILPRNAIARKTALKNVRLAKGKRNWGRAPFYETGLLKEKVEGPFGVKVSVTRPLNHAEFSRFVRKLLATGLESSVDLLSPALAVATGSSILSDLADEAADQLADAVEGKEAVFIAEGGLDLDSETLVDGPIHIPLRLTEGVRQSDQPPGPRARDNRRANTRLFRKGSPVGEIVLALRA